MPAYPRSTPRLPPASKRTRNSRLHFSIPYLFTADARPSSLTLYLGPNSLDPKSTDGKLSGIREFITVTVLRAFPECEETRVFCATPDAANDLWLPIKDALSGCMKVVQFHTTFPDSGGTIDRIITPGGPVAQTISIPTTAIASPSFDVLASQDRTTCFRVFESGEHVGNDIAPAIIRFVRRQKVLRRLVVTAVVHRSFHEIFEAAVAYPTIQEIEITPPLNYLRFDDSDWEAAKLTVEKGIRMFPSDRLALLSLPVEFAISPGFFPALERYTSLEQLIITHDGREDVSGTIASQIPDNFVLACVRQLVIEHRASRPHDQVAINALRNRFPNAQIV